MTEETRRKAVAIVSGGMDSATLLYRLANEKWDITALTFDYGQRHRKELEYAARLTMRLQSDGIPIRHRIVDLPIARLLKGSALTDPNVEVPEGHYAEENMRLTVVPNRNAIMLSIAYGVAVAEKSVAVAAAMHTGDYIVYPDCRPSFTEAFNRAMQIGNQGFIDPYLFIYTPFIHRSKAQIVEEGQRLGVPWGGTWSCYQGDTLHCGACGTCVERIEAFRIAKVSDPTDYDAKGLEKYEALKEKGVVKS